MKNPNNCATCSHSLHSGGGHCYMYKTAPTVACVSHTGNRLSFWRLLSQMQPSKPPSQQ